MIKPCVTCVNIAGLIERDIEPLLKFISISKRERLSQYSRKIDVIRSLIADLLVRHYITNKTNLSNNLIKFSYNSHGKPYIQGDYSLHFNISHSGDWVVACFFCDEIGIDVEQIKSIGYLGIAKKTFCADEFNSLLALDILERPNYFTSIWALKESYVKALGVGLSIELNTFSFNINREQVLFNNINCVKPSFSLVSLDANHRMALCSFHNFDNPCDISVIKFDDLYRFVLNNLSAIV